MTLTNAEQATECDIELISIDDAPPDDLGGIYARQGFAFQDDVAARYLIMMIEDDSLQEVRCESNEDITLVWKRSEFKEVEFVQVKAEHPDQLWSIAKLTERKKSKENPSGAGSSILEKNLSWDRYKETSIFKIVTCRQVNKELSLLTHSIDHPLRSDGGEDVESVKKQIEEKLSGFKSKKGNDTDFWVLNTVWSIYDEQHIQALNKRKLSEVLFNVGFQSDPERDNEIYDAIRALAKKRAELGVERWKEKAINRTELLSFIKNIAEPYPDKTKSQKLEEKILGAGLDDTCLGVAKDQQRFYLTKKRSSEYFTADESEEVDMRVLSTLHRLRSSLDSGDIKEAPVSFHNKCLQEVEKVTK